MKHLKKNKTIKWEGILGVECKNEEDRVKF
jgi:hypothetical protein